jgi:hypothetical protein
MGSARESEQVAVLRHLSEGNEFGLRGGQTLSF